MNDTLTKQQTVARQIADLSQMAMAELWPLWDRYFPRRPDYPNRTHVESRIAYKLQEEAFGGLAPETKQRLEAIGAKHSKINILQMIKLMQSRICQFGSHMLKMMVQLIRLYV